MSLSQGLRWSGQGVSNGRQRLVLGTSSVRHYSLKAPRSILSFSRTPRTTNSARINTYQQTRSLSLFGWGSKSTSDDFSKSHNTTVSEDTTQAVTSADNIRTIKASYSTSDTPDSPASHSHTIADHIPDGLQKLEDAIVNPHGVTPPAEKLAEIPDLASIPEGIGYLKEVCGLDFGWGPSAMVEYCIEHLHITAGLSWSASILTFGVVFRLIIMRFALKASEESNKMKELAPVIKPLDEKRKAAMARNDRAAALEIQQEITAVRSEYGLKFSTMFLPMLLQVPVQFGAFRVLSAAGRLPVPAFETEQWLWLTSLSSTDPTYILPAIIAGFAYFNISKTAKQNPENPVLKYMRAGLPPLSFAVMIWQPAGLHLFFLVNGIANQIQLSMIQSPRARKLLRLSPVPDPSLTTAPAGPTYGRMNVAMPQQHKPSTENQPIAGSEDRSVIDRGVDKVKGSFKNTVDPIKKMIKKTQEKQREKIESERSQEQRRKWDVKREEELEAGRQRRNRGRKE